MPRTEPIKAVRGVRDILPEERALWRVAERAAARVAHRFGYREIQTPVIEHLELIERVGEDTDAVSKELYRFEDRGGRQLALRPEATAGGGARGSRLQGTPRPPAAPKASAAEGRPRVRRRRGSAHLTAAPARVSR